MRLALVLFAVGSLGLFVALVWHVVSPFVFAAVVAYVLAPVVQWMEGLHVPRVLAVLLCYVGAAGLMALAAYGVVPLAVHQAMALADALPTVVWHGQHIASEVARGIREVPWPAPVRGALQGETGRLRGTMTALVRRVLDYGLGLLPGALALVVSPILAFYLLKDLDRIKQRFFHVVPVEWQPAVYKLGRDVDRTLAGYVRGQVVVALFVGLLSGLWTALLGIPFAALVGVLAAVTDVVPYVGPIIGALPAVALGLLRSPWVGLYAAAGFVAIHELEGTVVAPIIVGEAVGLHPLLVVLAILVGGETAGLSGMLVAVPMTAVLKVLGNHLYRRLAERSPVRIGFDGQAPASDQAPRVDSRFPSPLQ